MNRQEQVEQLEYEINLENEIAAAGHYEPDYEFLAVRVNKICALLDERDGRSGAIVI
jgi:hypothetical protein